MLEAELDTDGLLHVLQEFRFRLNISSGSVSNNNNPTVLQNFTPYPTVQPAPQNYKSGTLSSLVGYVDYSQGVPTYINTIQMRDAILSLSNTQNYIILKNPVGDVFPVRTNGPITVQIKDKTMEQIMTISIPWVQTAEEPSASVVSTPGDTFWPYN